MPSIASAPPNITPARMHSSVRRPITRGGTVSSVAGSFDVRRVSVSADVRMPGAITPPRNTPSAVMQSYVAGIKSYASLMQRYADFCATPGITTASARAFVSSLQPEVAALTDDSQAVMVEADKVSVSDVAAR